MKFKCLLHSLFIASALLSQNIYSQEMENTLWLKSGAVVRSGKLIATRYELSDGGQLGIAYSEMDSILTKDSMLVEFLKDTHKGLKISKASRGFMIIGFGEIKRRAINLALEVWGKSLVGGINVGYIYDEKHSFDLGYGNGEAANGFGGGIIGKNIYYASYAYLIGRTHHKLEIGPGIAFGRSKFMSKFLSDDVTDRFDGLMLSATLGYRYQQHSSGFFFKYGFSQILFTSPKVKGILFMDMGFGYTFGF